MPLFPFLAILHWPEPTVLNKFHFDENPLLFLVWVCLFLPIFRSSASTTICRFTDWSTNHMTLHRPREFFFKTKEVQQWVQDSGIYQSYLIRYHSGAAGLKEWQNYLLWCQLGNDTQEGCDIISKNLVCTLNQWLLYSAVFSIGKKTRAPKVEILMTLVTHFPSLLVTQSRKFCLPSPQLWVLWVYRWMAKVPLNFFFQDSCQGTSWEKEELQSWQGWWYLEETIENKKTLG